MASKIVSLENLPLLPRPLVYCHGCYDILHFGHVTHLREAKRRGATLIVTVTADKYINKGIGRPVFTDKQRAEMLAALDCVDYVAINNSPDAIRALSIIRPDFYVKGRDYKNITCEEFESAKKMGIELIFSNTEKFSTTELIERIRAW